MAVFKSYTALDEVNTVHGYTGLVGFAKKDDFVNNDSESDERIERAPFPA